MLMKLPPAEFFDIFGIFGFIYIIVFSSWLLFIQSISPRWPVYILLLIGITGLIIDSAVVYKNYLK